MSAPRSRGFLGLSNAMSGWEGPRLPDFPAVHTLMAKPSIRRLETTGGEYSFKEQSVPRPPAIQPR